MPIIISSRIKLLRMSKRDIEPATAAKENLESESNHGNTSERS